MSSLGLRLTTSATRASISSSASRLKSRWGTRRLHQRQPLPYNAEEGLGKFLPPEALRVQLEYQDGLLERLNEEVAGTGEAGTSIAQTVINLSGRQDKVLAFNYASLALNNSFFLNNLKPPSDQYENYEHELTTNSLSAIRTSHGSVQQLRSAFSAAALGMFINGWVWFIADQTGNTGVVTTYGAGTLLIRSRSHMQVRPNTVDGPNPRSTSVNPPFSSPNRSPLAHPPPPGTSPSSPLSGISGDTSPSAPADLRPRFVSTNMADLMGPANGLYNQPFNRMRVGDKLRAGEIIYPLFCVPVYEHAWMSAGYGVWGKEAWLKQFWSVLDWQKVDASLCDVLNLASKGNKKKY